LSEDKLEPKLSELLDTITTRLKDAIRDMEAAARCIEAYKADPTGAQACILEYLKTGTEKIKTSL
jgi:hypothetical protein